MHKPSGYICCDCGMRYTERDSSYVYKTSCICKQCFGKLEETPYPMHFLSAAHKNFVYSPFYYTPEFRDLFAAFKFRGNEACGHMLGMAAAERLGSIDALRGYDAITPVPLSRQRFNERGYNQSEIMARYLASALDIPIEPLLIKVHDTKPQSSVTNRNKFFNILGAFRANADAKGKRVIVFDDIHTSGTTLGECAKELKSAGASDVCLISVSFVPVIKR